MVTKSSQGCGAKRRVSFVEGTKGGNAASSFGRRCNVRPAVVAGNAAKHASPDDSCRVEDDGWESENQNPCSWFLLHVLPRIRWKASRISGFVERSWDWGHSLDSRARNGPVQHRRPILIVNVVGARSQILGVLHKNWPGTARSGIFNDGKVWGWRLDRSMGSDAHLCGFRLLDRRTVAGHVQLSHVHRHSCVWDFDLRRICHHGMRVGHQGPAGRASARHLARLLLHHLLHARPPVRRARAGPRHARRRCLDRRLRQQHRQRSGERGDPGQLC
mmetsp:Transcript_4850/g.9606  ORF Transcript_4850/g.9606 Transcript_4850/m.9606 type:complete len:274 (-) Transcript_4850:265-1086(-)